MGGTIYVIRNVKDGVTTYVSSLNPLPPEKGVGPHFHWELTPDLGKAERFKDQEAAKFTASVLQKRDGIDVEVIALQTK